MEQNSFALLGNETASFSHFTEKVDYRLNRLAIDESAIKNFSALMQGAKEGLTQSSTVLSKKVFNSGDPVSQPGSVGEKLIRDITSLEKGFETMFRTNDKTAAKHNEMAGKEHEMAETAGVLFEYLNFSPKYYVATNYASGAGQRTAEEMQIFSRGK